MNVKVTCYGVRENENEVFYQYNHYGYKLNLVSDLLTHENAYLAQGSDAVILRSNCMADRVNLERFASWGIRYVFTRTSGFNHIDLQACQEFGLMVAYVPSYSPNAIAELSLTLAMSLLRNVAYTLYQTSKLDFRVTKQMFSREIRNCTVGIIGVGRIGSVEARLFHGLGAKVLGYNLHSRVSSQGIVSFVELDELLAQSDIITIHAQYIPGKNDKMINATMIEKMKRGVILVNTARGELQDNKAILDALKSNHISGFAADVIEEETMYFGHQFSCLQEIEDEVVQELFSLYPRVLITPHIGSNTDEALANRIATSFENLNDVLTHGKTVNEIVYQESL